MTTYRIRALAAAMLCAASAPAFAQSTAMAGQLLANADANHDGVISHEEFIEARARLFPQLDRNHDGQLDAGELQAMGGDASRFAGMAIRRADGNGDGRLSQVEFNAMPTRMFDQLDRNHDGVLDQTEITAARAQTGQMAGQMAGQVRMLQGAVH